MWSELWFRFFFYLISHIKCFSCTSSWVASLTAAVANTNFNEMNWRVRECPLLNIYTCGIFDWINTIWPDDMLCICNLKSDIGGNDVDGRGIAKVNAILDSLFVVVASIDVSLCVTLMASTHVSRGYPCAHTMCTALRCTDRTANVNKCPSTRLKSIYVQSIFHLCQFKLIETKWKLSADFYTSFSGRCRGSCLISLTAAVRRVFFCRFVAIVRVVFCLVFAYELVMRECPHGSYKCETHTQKSRCQCRDWERYWSNKCRMDFHRIYRTIYRGW